MYILSRGQDLGLVLGPLLGGLVLAVSFAQLDQALENRRRLIRTLVETRSQLARTERESGALAERTRVASELHDTVVQQTATALLLLEAATETPARIDEARDVLRASLSETRHLMHGLTSALVSEGSLVAALRDLSAEHAAAFVVVGEERPLPEATAHALLRVSQEALTNAAKHADAPRTAVTLTFFDGLVGVDIADNGAGFDPAARAGASDTGLDSPELAGYGLRAMAWRVESLGGTFTLETAPGSGTVIAAVIPDGTAATAPENGARR
nr:ATP-binding protein [Leucobacter luti]